ncbi:MAG: M13 family peptidase, partial [Janthinobacterium sp.]
MKRSLISAACCALFAFSSPSLYAQATNATAPVSGIDLKTLDPAVSPRDDFYGYVNGVWTRNTEIPADKS